jgi:hypothetical protein
MTPKHNGLTIVRVPRQYQGVPPIMESDFTLMATFVVTAGNLFGNVASINVAAFHAPLSAVTYTFTGSAGSTPFDASGTQGTLIGNDPIGYAAMAQLYTNFLVKSYSIEIRAQPQNAGDTVSHAIFPSGGQEIPTSGSWSFYRASGQSLAKVGIAVSGANTRQNYLILRGTPYEALGLTYNQWETLGKSNMGSSPNLSSYVVYGAFTSDGAVSAAPCTFTVTVRLRVRLTDPVQFNA